MLLRRIDAGLERDDPSLARRLATFRLTTLAPAEPGDGARDPVPWRPARSAIVIVSVALAAAVLLLVLVMLSVRPPCERPATVPPAAPTAASTAADARPGAAPVRVLLTWAAGFRRRVRWKVDGRAGPRKGLRPEGKVAMHVLRLCPVFEPPPSALLGRGVRFDPIGGMQNHAAQLSRALDGLGVRQTVVTTRPPDAPAIARLGRHGRVVRLGLPVAVLRQGYAAAAWLRAPGLADGADLVHAHLGEDPAVLTGRGTSPRTRGRRWW
ncbi:hypothetical protein BJF79_23220 [Actinomadura sp. CNU-125]|nr:hypothetical protein BJF79_23220 [Actinomadura sp. CNU-125]